MPDIIFKRPYIKRSEISDECLVPATQAEPPVIKNLIQHFMKASKRNKTGMSFRHMTHPARCQAINKVKQLGWILKNDIPIEGKHDVNEQGISMFLRHYEYDKDKWAMVKFDSLWITYIPPGYELICQPAAYHSSRYIAMPGILNGDEGAHHMNLFLLVEKGYTIPEGSPLAQWYLKKIDEKPNAIFDDQDQMDLHGQMLKENALYDDDKMTMERKRREDAYFYNPLYK